MFLIKSVAYSNATSEFFEKSVGKRMFICPVLVVTMNVKLHGNSCIINDVCQQGNGLLSFIDGLSHLSVVLLG